MSNFKVFKISKGLKEENDKIANLTRNGLKEKGIYMVNIMSSPGSGKTSTLVRTIEGLKNEFKVGVMEADVDSDVDAVAVENAGAKAIQLHTGGMCHLDATMTKQGLDEMGVEGLDIIFLENIGNLICPVGYDTGAMLNVAILSVPEGDDKPLKYPDIFCKVDVLIINKIDTISLFDFDFDVLEERVRKLNPNIKIFALSAKTNEGVDSWVKYLKNVLRG